MQQAMGARMSNGWSLLAGRRTYEQFADYWPKQPPNRFTEALGRCRKYVASTTLTEPLAWQNSILLKGDATDTIARLKEELDENLVVFGSGVLVRSLMPQGLIDEFVLLVYPLVLGSGRRLFAESGSAPSAFQLTESTTTSTGVIISAYQPAGESAG